jgi:hypothetical protein
MDTS